MLMVDTVSGRSYSVPAPANSGAGFGDPNVTGGHSRHQSGFFVSKSMASPMGGPCGIPFGVCRVPVTRFANLHGSAHPFGEGCADKRPHNRSFAMTSVIPFAFQNHSIRVIQKDNQPWFVARDVCDALGLVNSRKSLTALDEDEKGVTSSDTLGGNQKLAIINESGLYTLILRCRDAVKPGSVPHQFRKWVTSEVLPSIRKTGSYAVTHTAQQRLEHASKTAMQIYKAALNELLVCERRPDRLLVSFGDHGIANVMAIEDRALVASLERLIHMLSQDGGVMATNSELANLARVCNEKLAARLGSAEKKSPPQMRIASQ